MSSGLLPLTTNNSNLLSISPHTPITTKTMVVVAKGWNMGCEKLWIVSFGRKCNFTRGSNAWMVVTFVVVESSIVQSESPYNMFWPSQKKNSNRKKQPFLMNSTCVLIKPPLMLTMIVVVPIESMTFAWWYEKVTDLKGDVDEINELP